MTGTQVMPAPYVPFVFSHCEVSLRRSATYTEPTAWLSEAVPVMVVGPTGT